MPAPGGQMPGYVCEVPSVIFGQNGLGRDGVQYFQFNCTIGAYNPGTHHYPYICEAVDVIVGK